MQKTVIILDGPIGVGKTTLGQAAALQLGFSFIDGDDHSGTGPWYTSILKTSRKIVAASENALAIDPAVIVAYPLRCTNWIYYNETFRRKNINCFCLGLTANIAAISARERYLSEEEVFRSKEMIDQGYGQRPFSSENIRTDVHKPDEDL